MGEPSRKSPDEPDSPRVRIIRWNGRDLPTELPEVPPGQYQLVPVPAGLEYTPGDDAVTDATTDEVCAWLNGEAPAPWPR